MFYASETAFSTSMEIIKEIYILIILSFAVASIAWTVTQEAIFGEWREYCSKRTEDSKSLLLRKFFYVWTCEYCFSHWVTLIVILLSGFRLLIDDWRGYVLAFFVLPWIANQWMSLYRRLRVEIKQENAIVEKIESSNGDSQYH